MTKSVGSKTALVGVLVASALLGPSKALFADGSGFWLAGGMLLFGIFNVLSPARGTGAVRAFAVAAAVCALLSPGEVLIVISFIVWLIWPPAFMVAWALEKERTAETIADPAPEPRDGHRARVTAAVIIGAVAAASIAFRILVMHNLEQTAALFVGIPTLLAIVVVFAVRPESAVGVACKAVTVGLLVSLLFLGEGLLCVAMSAPLFYAVAVVIGGTMDAIRNRRQGSSPRLYSCAILLAIAPMSLEGVTSLTTLNRDEAVAASKIVRASAADLERALFAAPRFDRQRPFFLRAGFPAAVASRVERHGNEQRWVIQVRGGETRVNGMEPRTGDLVLMLEDTRPGLVRWRVLSDSSHTTHFLDWRESIVQWEPIDARTTRVSWTLTYRRGLDPAWYFGPMERYAARLAAGYLIDVVATP